MRDISNELLSWIKGAAPMAGPMGNLWCRHKQRPPPWAKIEFARLCKKHFGKTPRRMMGEERARLAGLTWEDWDARAKARAREFPRPAHEEREAPEWDGSLGEGIIDTE